MSIRLRHLAVAAFAAAMVAATGVGVTQAQNQTAQNQTAQNQAPADPIAARKAVMKANGESMRVIKGAVDANGPAATVATEAAKVAGNLKAAAIHFVPGSDKGDTKAAPEIWTNLGDFQKLDNDSHAAALKLEASAKGGDMKMVAADFGDLGKTCGACHNKYRLK